MSKDIVEINGFDKLRSKLEQLDDRVKRRELLKVTRQAANPTLAAARTEVPVSRSEHVVSGSRTRQVIQPGNLKKSLGKITGKNKQAAVVYVGPRAKGKHDGWYGHFVHHGTKRGIKANPFMERAYNRNRGAVTRDYEQRVERYIAKQIKRLSNA